MYHVYKKSYLLGVAVVVDDVPVNINVISKTF